VPDYENAISARKKTQIQSSWISGKNEYSRRKKSIICEKSKRKKSIVSVSLLRIIAEGVFESVVCLIRQAYSGFKSPLCAVIRFYLKGNRMIDMLF